MRYIIGAIIALSILGALFAAWSLGDDDVLPAPSPKTKRNGPEALP